MKNRVFVFVYAKEKEIKVLSENKAKMLHDKLLKNGWIHTSTLDACMYIQYLHNNRLDIDLLKEIEDLSNIKN